MVVIDGKAAGVLRQKRGEYSGWRCPNAECENAKLVRVNGMHKDQSIKGTRRRVFRCRKCKQNFTEEAKITNTNRRSTYMPRAGQYRGRAKR